MANAPHRFGNIFGAAATLAAVYRSAKTYLAGRDTHIEARCIKAAIGHHPLADILAN
nr:hypothetical protein [Sphingopyxis terrae]